jgi:hypothetical protein
LLERSSDTLADDPAPLAVSSNARAMYRIGVNHEFRQKHR